MIIRARAPLRVGLAGGGTDLSPFCDIYGGYVLNATIDLYAYAHIESTNDRTVEISAPDIAEQYVGRAVSRMEPDGPLALQKAVINRIVKDFRRGDPLPLRMVTYCDVPPGSGLGSSSTLVVAIVKAFVELLRLPLGEYDVARLAFEVERRDLGWSGGRQDQYAATFGGFNFMEFYANERIIVNPLRIKNWILPDSMDAMKALKDDALRTKESVLKGDFCQFAHYIGKSWEAKKRVAEGITNSYIDRVFDVAKNAGARAGKLSGAGGGGFALFVVDPAKRMDVMRALTQTGGEVRPCHFTKNGTEGWRLD